MSLTVAKIKALRDALMAVPPIDKIVVVYDENGRLVPSESDQAIIDALFPEGKP